MVSLYDLAYARASRTVPCPPSLKRRIIDEIRGQLADGWTERDVQLGICREGDNLLDPFRFYYHSRLHIAPPAPTLFFDLESGICHSAETTWYLEMRASYTVRELAQYYLSRTGENGQAADRVNGALKWLVGRYDIELILFMVDALRASVEGGLCLPPTSPLQLRDFERSAREAMEQKQTEMVLMGVNHVVPRERAHLPVS